MLECVCLCGCMQVFQLQSSNLSLFFFFLFFSPPGYRSRGRTPWWTPGTLTIPGHQWTTPPDTNRADSGNTHLSFSVRFSRSPALSNCQAGPLSVSLLPFTLLPSPRPPPPPPPPPPLGACWQWADLEEGCRCDKYRWPRLFSSQTFLIPHRLLTFFNWSKQVMCNQLPSGSIFHSQSDPWLTGEPGWLVARQPGGASAKPNRCQEWEIQQRSVTSFIRDIFLVLSFWQTSSRLRKRTFERCKNALLQ